MTERQRDPEVARLAFEAATERVAHQAASVDELRGRASTLLGTSAIATSFLAGFALTNRDEPLTVFAWMGFVSAVAVAVFVALILRPRAGWVFAHDPDPLLKQYYRGEFDDSDGPLSLEESHVYLTEYMAGWIQGNAEKLEAQFRLFEYAVVAVGALVVAWIFDLILTT
jgi:hypothetical protein